MAKKADKKDPKIEEQPPVSTSQYASKIDAIKDIIFGEENAALRKALQDLEAKIDRDMTAMGENLGNLIEENDKALNNRIDNMEMDLKSEIDRLDYNKSDRFKLGKMLEDMGKSLQEK